MKSSRGFTLVEILIALMIIGFLVLIVMASLRGSNEKAQIAKAEVEIREIYTAMRVYREDLNQMPPATDLCTACVHLGIGGGADVSDWTLVVDALHPEYLSARIDRDPWGNYYAYDNNYRFGAFVSSYSSVYSADPDIDESDGIPTYLCSLGPDGVLQTGIVPGDPPDGDGPGPVGRRNDPYMQTGTYGPEGDDICIFIYDSD